MDDFGRRALAAREDSQSLNNFIEENKRFVLTSAYHALNHFVSDHDDEYSIALIAFSEAIENYDETKGAFASFASMVIRRRLVDYLRVQSKHAPEISTETAILDGDLSQTEQVTALQLEIADKTAFLSGEAAGSVRYRPESGPIHDEIEAVSQLLEPYGFSFMELAECSPRTIKTKKACALAVAVLLQSPELFEKMRRTRALPAKELRLAGGLTAKLLDRHRRYIIAAAEILNGEYPLLAEYMSYIRKALQT